jgi:threonine dehydratase
VTVPPTTDDLVTLTEIRAAATRLAGRVLRTPLVPLSTADTDRSLWLKAESLQVTGAFKLRGAYNAILPRLAEARRHGVVAHSSGNHARAVAWVAHELGVHAVIVMPDAAPPVKVDAVRALGAAVQIVTPDRRDTRAAELAADSGMVLVPPYDDAAIVAGQGTVGLEVIEDRPDVDVVLVPVSGGGLISGVATAVKSLKPDASVIGVEPTLAGDAAESFHAGRLVTWTPQQTYRTVADGLRTTSLGQIPWRHVQRYVDDILTVDEDEIRDAVRRIAAGCRLVAEPSGAVATAAYLHRPSQLPATGRFVAVVSGGNVAMNTYAEILAAPPEPGQ